MEFYGVLFCISGTLHFLHYSKTWWTWLSWLVILLDIGLDSLCLPMRWWCVGTQFRKSRSTVMHLYPGKCVKPCPNASSQATHNSATSSYVLRLMCNMQGILKDGLSCVHCTKVCQRECIQHSLWEMQPEQSEQTSMIISDRLSCLPSCRECVGAEWVMRIAWNLSHIWCTYVGKCSKSQQTNLILMEMLCLFYRIVHC